MFNKKSVTKQKTKSSNKKKLVIGLATAGTFAFAGVIVAGSIAATRINTKTQSKAPEYVSTNSSLLVSGGKPYSGSSIALSPVSFNNSISNNNTSASLFSSKTNKPTIFADTLEALNNIGIQWLNAYNQQSLKIVNYYLAQPATFASSSLEFAALQIINPNKVPVQFQYKSNENAKTSYFFIEPGQKVWIYMQNGNVEYTTNAALSTNIINNFSYIDNLFTINNLSNAFTTQKKNGQVIYTAPKLPVTTPIEICKSILNDNGSSIVQKDLYNLFNFFACGKVINANVQGTQAQIQFQKLNVDWAGSKFIPSSQSPTGKPQFILGGLTGTLTVGVKSLGQSLTFNIDNNQPMTFNLTPILLWQQDGTIQTSPTIAQNTISGTVFSNSENPNMPSDPSQLHLGYGINAANPQSDLCLLLPNGKKFSMVNIAFSFLFYNFWMTNRDITSSLNTKNITTPSNSNDLGFSDASNFGSVYQNGATSLKGTKSIPTSWINGMPVAETNSNNSDTYQEVNSTGIINLDTESSNLQEYISDNLNALINNENPNDFTVTSQNCPSLYNQLLQKTNLINLNSNLKVKSFNVAVEFENNVAIINVKSAAVYNYAYYTHLNNDAVQYSNIYYLNIKGSSVPVAIYPLNNLKNIAQIPLNYNIYLNSNKVATNLSFDSPISINFATINNNQFVTSTNAMDLINKDSYYNTKIIDYITKEFEQIDSNFKDLKIVNLTYKVNGNYIDITSFNLLNTSNSCVNLNFFNVSYVFSPYQELNISNHAFTITGFILTLNLNQNVDVADSNYPYLMLNNINLSGNENPDSTHNIQMRQAISNLISDGYLTVLNYQACVVTGASGKNTLEFNSLELQNNSTINTILLDPTSSNPISVAPESTIFLNAIGSSVYASLTDFNTMLVPSNKTIANQYLSNCKSWLQTLTASDIQNDFANMANVTNNYVTTMPSDAILNYSNFDCQISNYDPSTQIATISKMTWDINGEATNIPLIGHIGLSVDLDQTTAVKFKMIPVIYFTYNGVKNSYPQIIATRSDYKSIDGVWKYLAVSTNLNYNFVPNMQDATNIRYGYYLEPVDGNCQFAGSGLSLKLTGADASFKPTLNISYAFNESVMFNHWNNNRITPISTSNEAPYGSYVQTAVAKPVTVNSYIINPFGAQDINIGQVSLSNYGINNFVQLSNYLTNSSNYSSIASLLQLPYSLTITNINIGGFDGIGELTINNPTNITYKLIENINNRYYAYFILPNEDGQEILFGENSLINVQNFYQNVSGSATYNLTSLVNSGNSGAVNYYNTTKNVAWFDQRYMYPLLFSSNSHDTYYKFNFSDIGPQYTYTMDSPSWTSYIDWANTPHPSMTFQMIWVAQILGFDSAIQQEFDGYKIYLNNSNGQVVISSIEVNNMWISGLDLTINPGSDFMLN